MSFTVRMDMNNYTTHDPFICMISINALSHDVGLLDPACNSGGYFAACHCGTSGLYPFRASPCHICDMD